MRSNMLLVLLSNVAILCSVCCSVPLHAQSVDTNPTSEKLWEAITGHWVRYAGDNIVHKVIADGQEKHYGESQYGDPKFEFLNEMKLSTEGNINFFTKLHPTTKKPIYKGAMKLHDGIFFEYSRGLFTDTSNAPQIWRYFPSDNAVYQLHMASRSGDKDKVRSILDSGVKADQTLENSYTALAYAAGAGNIDVMQLLLDRGANVNKRARFGKTPLNYAVGGGSQEACELLITSGASLNQVNWNGGNLLHEAAFWGRAKMIPFFLGKGLDINGASNFGASPLIYATTRAKKAQDEEARAKFLECIKVLLQNGADPDLKAEDGKSAKDIADQAAIPAIKALL